jgi:hypothetical protein
MTTLTIGWLLVAAMLAIDVGLLCKVIANRRRIRWERQRIAELTALLDAADCVTQAGLARAGEAMRPLPDDLPRGRDTLRIIARRRPR